MAALLHDAALDREWQTLQRKIGRARGFTFVVYFAADERGAIELKERLRDSLRARTAHLSIISVERADELAAQSLGEIFESVELPEHREVCAPFWLEALRGAGDKAWDDARRELLMRLNERRSRLEAEVRCPLILLLPGGWEREAASLAPDLWHVRIHSAALRGAPPALAERARPAEAESPRPPQPAMAPEAGVPREVDFWKRQLKATGAAAWWRRVLDALRRAPAPEVSLRDGVAAIDALLARWRFDEASEVADGVLRLARESAARPAAGSEQPLRTLSAVLDRVGDIAQAQGRLDAAARAYEESLELCRRLLREQGDSPQALRDLSVSLDRVGDVAQAQGRLDAAARAYEESLELARRLLREQGDSPQASRDLSVSLNKVGDVARAQGRLDAAARAYDESLELHSRLLREQGENPQVLDDLAVSLERVAALADTDAARRTEAIEEAMRIRRRLARAYPALEYHRERLEGAQRLADSIRPASPNP